MMCLIIKWAALSVIALFFYVFGVISGYNRGYDDGDSHIPREFL